MKYTIFPEHHASSYHNCTTFEYRPRPHIKVTIFPHITSPPNLCIHTQPTTPIYPPPPHAPNWKGLCDSFIRTAEIDPLRDEGEAYGMKLLAGGNKVTMKRYLGSPHTFMYFKFMGQKGEFDLDSIEALKAAHGVVGGR